MGVERSLLIVSTGGQVAGSNLGPGGLIPFVPGNTCFCLYLVFYHV